MTDVLEILDGGVLTTIQDLGRPDHLREAVPRAGAADPLGHALANLLAGNPEGAATIEGTIAGLRFRVLRDVSIALAGADLGATIEGGARLRPGAACELVAGATVRFDGRPDDALGCRAYLAVAGGFDVPLVLGSRSTSLVGGFGGLEGRSLRSGDRIAAGPSSGTARTRRLPSDVALPSPAQRIRILPGPEHAHLDELLARPWIVARDSDRRGLRLESAGPPAGPRLRPSGGAPPGPAADRPSHGVVPGAIQVTPTGQPLVLMPDAGTTGGYPVAAIVISADLPLLGQLAPGDEVRLRLVDPGGARAAALERRELLARLRTRIGPA
jgi:biotin-dependent carboxylase-like uncharacterized protein